MDAYARRRIVDRVARGCCVLATVVAVVPLGLVLYYVASKGIGALDAAFFTELPRPMGEPGGGMANAIVGSLQLIGMAALIGIPPGVLAGVYLAEFGAGRFALVVRFAADVMAGIPSITVGIFVYATVVRPMGGFSSIAGAVALAVLMLPIVTRTTEELLRLVPVAIREAGLGLGVARWRVISFVVLRAAGPGVATGVMLAVARAAGETAPLLFTSPGNLYWSGGVDEPVSSLPVKIYEYATSADPVWIEQAWGAALVLLLLVMLLDVSARMLLRRGAGR